MTSGGGFTDIHWNPYGLPIEIDGNPSLWLGYTADKALLTKTVYGQSQWRYFGNLFVQQGSDGWRERIFVGGEAVAIVSVTSAGFTSVEYLVHDNLGSPSVVTDSAGNVTGRLAYDAWGDLVNPAKGWGSDPNASSDEALTTLGYTGHEEFWEQGLVHTYARVYMPGIGRWLSPDPTVPDLYDGQSLNRYSYALNNPTTYSDPLGYSSSGGQLLCAPEQQGSLPDGGGKISSEILNAGKAFVTLGALKYWGGSTGLSEASVYADVLNAMDMTARTTIRNGINDITYYLVTGNHYIDQGSLLWHGGATNWYNLQVPWENWGASPGAGLIMTKTEVFKTAISTLCNFFQDANSKKSSSRNGSGGGGMGDSGFAGRDPFIHVTTECYSSQREESINGGPWIPIGPVVTSCFTTLT